MQNLFGDQHLSVSEDALLRKMGYRGSRSVSEPVREICVEQLRRLDQFIQPWGGSGEIGIDGINGDTVVLAGGRTLHGANLANTLRCATSLTICLGTVGPSIMAEIKALAAADCTVEGLALDAAGSVALTLFMTQLRKRVAADAKARNCSTTLRYGSDHRGWKGENSTTLLSYLGGEALPVGLNERRMLVPEKSLLEVIGLVPALGGTRAGGQDPR